MHCAKMAARIKMWTRVRHRYVVLDRVPVPSQQGEGYLMRPSPNYFGHLFTFHTFYCYKRCQNFMQIITKNNLKQRVYPLPQG